MANFNVDVPIRTYIVLSPTVRNAVLKEFNSVFEYFFY